MRLMHTKSMKNMKLMRLLWLGLIVTMAACILVAPTVPAVADIGVGVDLREISIDELLTPGNVYQLPAVGVINTGDRTSDYEVVVTYMNEQNEMTPPAAWFQFDPKRFSVEPGISKSIAISLHIPRDATAGDYFALIEAHPVVTGSSGTVIAIAAATKLRFSVKEVSTAASMLNAIGDAFSNSSPYSYIGLGLVGAAILFFLIRRFFRFRFKVERR